MVDFKDVSIIVPAYNEEATIAEIIERIIKISSDFEVIVCSDGSTDNTAEIARSCGAKIVDHIYNIGNGAAVQSGASRATRDYLVFIDGDLQHQPEEIPVLLEFLPAYDMVVGARSKNSQSSHVRSIGNFLLTKTAQLISGHRIEDLTSGFRAVKKNCFLRFSHLYPLQYSYPTTITLAFFNAGYFVKYVSLGSVKKRIHGTSDIKPIRDGFRFTHIILRVVMMFNPIKIFLPISVGLFALGTIVAIIQLLLTGGIQSTAIIITISAVIIFLNGLLAEQISQIRLNQENKHNISDSFDDLSSGSSS